MTWRAIAIAGVAVAIIGVGSGVRADTNQAAAAHRTGPPDIYYLIFDRYGNGEALDTVYGFDNGPFLRELERRGFYVAGDSQANYLKTAFSLVSSLEMEYLDAAQLASEATSEVDYEPLHRRLLAPLAVQEFLKAQGYTYVHVGTWWEGTAGNAAADIVFRLGDPAESASDLRGLTPQDELESIYGDPQASEPPGSWRAGCNCRAHALYQFDRLMRIPEIPGPKFVFAHIALPHTPYIFDREGGHVTAEEAEARPREFSYAEHVRYVNSRILELLDVLMAESASPRPVVILQADEGPWPVGYSDDQWEYDWLAASPSDLREKFGILNAYYLPDREPEEAGLYSSISPVNSFRVVLNSYFDQTMPMLPDRHYAFSDQSHLYDLHDVTLRLRAETATPPR